MILALIVCVTGVAEQFAIAEAKLRAWSSVDGDESNDDSYDEDFLPANEPTTQSTGTHTISHCNTPSMWVLFTSLAVYFRLFIFYFSATVLLSVILIPLFLSPHTSLSFSCSCFNMA